MIDGKLAELGWDPRDVQVIVRTDLRGQEMLSLRDMDGVSVEAGMPECPDEAGAMDGDGDGRDEREELDSTSSERRDVPADEELEELRTQNAELSTCTSELRDKVTSLEDEVSEVRDMLKKESERVCEM